MTILANSYRARYAQWLPKALALLEKEQYGEALKDFPRPDVGATPFRVATTPKRLALITSSGAFDASTQAPFVETSAVGDVTHRVFASDLPAAQLAFRHGHYDRSIAESDPEVVLPREALRAAGATLTPHIVSFMGYCIDWPTFIEQTIPEIIKAVLVDEADGALLVPV